MDNEGCNNAWTSVVSGKSMTVLKTPLIDYFTEHLIAELGEEPARQVVAHAYIYMTKMDEGIIRNTFDKQLANIVYPIYGLAEGMIELHYDPQYSRDLLMQLWEAAPQELKAQPFDEVK